MENLVGLCALKSPQTRRKKNGPVITDDRPIWWEKMDSNHRSEDATDLQSAPFGHSGILPYSIIKWSWQTDSNPRPADYKSAALPAELCQHEKCLPLSEECLIIIAKAFLKIKSFLKKYCRGTLDGKTWMPHNRKTERGAAVHLPCAARKKEDVFQWNLQKYILPICVPARAPTCSKSWKN